MNTKLQYRFDQLEEDRIRLLDALSKYPETRFDYKSEPTRWSINQILIHLLTSEQLTLAYLKKKSLGINQLRNSGPIESVKITLLTIFQRMPFKFKAPTLVAQHTPNPVPLRDLAERWSLSRIELKQFLESIHANNVHKLIFKHPVAGRFDAVQCLIFMREHFRHHVPQINRLL
ncbi:MAG: DinB family protein [Cyclobacteriaceae bacterium]|nr:DinB family protein [Cyclobacteriaceae bacterium]MDH4298156.1 DinB family protein [Cyclobacteriaceae bacterium]MDH5249731.1 DinB family protein [Cyclobacteriaceae bacterium]